MSCNVNLSSPIRIQESNGGAATNGNKRKPSISLGQDEDDWSQGADITQDQEPDHQSQQDSQSFDPGSAWAPEQESSHKHHTGALNIR